MTIPNKQFIDGMHVHQEDVLKAFDEGNTWSFWLEWARRHRKTTLAINLLIREACRYPKAKYIYASPYQAETRKIVWDDPTMLPNALPDKKEMDYKLNDTKMLITFANGSMIQFGGADEPDSLKGIDAIGIVLDERALMKEIVWTEVLLPITMGPIPPHLANTGIFRWVMNLYTPKGVNHATIGFDRAACVDEGSPLPECGKAIRMKPGHYASRLDGEKAGIMSKAALDIAKNETTLVLYEQEFRCRRVTSEEMTLITSAMIHKLNEYHAKTRTVPLETRRIVSIDPAFGGDVCEIGGMENNEIIEEETVRNKHDAAEIVLIAKQVAQRIGTKNFIVDSINDGGVSELLRNDATEYNVQSFKSSHAPITGKNVKDAKPNVQFVNKRAQAYFYTSEQIRSFKTGPIKDPELRRHLSLASRYKQAQKGKLLIIPKEIIKKDLTCSPDKADMFTMGVYGSQFVEPEGKKAEHRKVVMSGVQVPSYIKRFA